MEAIEVTVPLTDLFAKSYCYFYKMHGCTIVETGERVYNMRIYRFTFPQGTQWLFDRSHCKTLILPTGICVDVVPTHGHSYLYLYIDHAKMNTVFLTHQQKGGANSHICL